MRLIEPGSTGLKPGPPRADHANVDTQVPNYDPGIIEAFAERLYDKAAAFVTGSVVAGAALGAAFGAVPLTSLGETWPIPSTFGFATMLVGAVAGGILGYRLGDARSFSYKLQAQAALCQLQIERNTSAAASARQPAQVPVAPAVAAQAPPAQQPQAAPVPVPMPVPVPEPEMRPVVVPAEAPLTGFTSPLRVAAPLNE
jgi:hypothetical protein